jgi:hypothetical protein
MQKHTKIYFEYFGYDESSWIGCECCQRRRAVDVHHIDARGMGGGSDELDVIENLMALCRLCHITFGDKEQHMEMLKEKHRDTMETKDCDI